MKIVHSLWSRPGKKKNDLNKCGWLDKKYNYFGWVLSALQFKKYYKELELVTDKAGYDLLINKLELPYTSVKVVLDDLNQYHPDLFALGKIYAYGIQEAPFIHVDADAFIWARFGDRLENAPLVSQNKEDAAFHNILYSKAFIEMAEKLPYYPEVLDTSIGKNNRVIAVNAGMLGGNNLAFIRDYARQAMTFVDKNARAFASAHVRNFNTIFEQVLFHALAEEKGLPIAYLTPNYLQFNHVMADFTRVPSGTAYIHLMGSLKKVRAVLDQLEHRLLLDYPDHYFKVLQLIRSNQI